MRTSKCRKAIYYDDRETSFVTPPYCPLITNTSPVKALPCLSPERVFALVPTLLGNDGVVLSVCSYTVEDSQRTVEGYTRLTQQLELLTAASRYGTVDYFDCNSPALREDIKYEPVEMLLCCCSYHHTEFKSLALCYS